MTRLALVGKTGTGKTTLSALIAEEYVARRRSVVAVDTDPYPNLGISLGLNADAVRTAAPVPRGMASGIGGSLTPPEVMTKYGLATPAGVTVLHGMRTEADGGRCFCFGHANPRSAMVATVEGEADVAIVDIEEGIEHLVNDRGTLARADVLLVVIESTRKSTLAAARTISVGRDVGAPRIAVVGNKARSADDAEFFANFALENGVTVAGVVPYDDSVVEADRRGTLVSAGSPELQRAIAGVVDFVEAAPA